MIYKKKYLLPFIIYNYIALIQANPCIANNGTRVWDNVLTDIIIDSSILSKACIIESSLELINQQLSSTDNLSNELGTITSYLEDIDALTQTAISKVNTLTISVNNTMNSELDLIKNSHLSIQSTVNVIDTRTNSIYSIDQSTSSLIDVDITLEDAILSKLMTIDSKTGNISASCSSIDQILQTEKSILSTLQIIDTRTSNIYNIDQTTLSYLQNINAHTLTVESTVNTLNQSVHTTVYSKLDLIENNNRLIQSNFNVIDTRTDSIYSIDQAISSQIDHNILIDQQTESIVMNINSKLAHISCSQLAQILATDQTVLSKINVINTKINGIQSNLDNIYSVDQNISSKVNTLSIIDTSISSKLDVNIEIDRAALSLADLIDAQISIGNPTCSLIAQLTPVDQSILSTLNVIETRTTNIQSNLNNIYNLSQTISSKIDADTPLQSNVDDLYNNINTVQSYSDNIVAIDTSIASKVATLSSCCNNRTPSLFGTQVVENTLDNISIQFQYGIPTYTTTPYTQGGGTVTSANSMAVLSTAASANSIAQLQTKNTIAYRSGHEAYALFTVAFTGTFVATSSQFIGPIDYQNGFAIGFDGTTFGVTRRTNTVNTFTPQSSFNGDKLDGTGPSGFLYNPALLNVFRISYGYLGASIIQFQIMNTTGGFITFHTIEYPNTSSTPSIFQPFLPITARVENLAGTPILTLQTASWNGGIIGQPNNSSYRYFATGSEVSGGSNVLILAIRNKRTFNNQPNKIEVRCSGIGGTRAAVSGTFSLLLIKNPTITGASFSDISPSNSVVEVSTTGSYSPGSGTTVFYQITADASNTIVNDIPLDAYNITILPGETLAVIVSEIDLGGVPMLVGINWEERF